MILNFIFESRLTIYLLNPLWDGIWTNNNQLLWKIEGKKDIPFIKNLHFVPMVSIVFFFFRFTFYFKSTKTYSYIFLPLFYSFDADILFDSASLKITWVELDISFFFFFSDTNQIAVSNYYKKLHSLPTVPMEKWFYRGWNLIFFEI